MSNIDSFYRKDCDKIDAKCVNAHLEFKVNEDSKTSVDLDTPWGDTTIDLSPIVKQSETVTRLSLSPEDNPNCLRFEREDGQSDCIKGGDLSKIITMTQLHDVNKDLEVSEGSVFIYHNGAWEPFDLANYLKNIEAAIDNLKISVNASTNKVSEIYRYWKLPAGVPEDASIVLGNINLYSDADSVIDEGGNIVALDKNNGLYSHSLTNDRVQDEIFG